MVLEMLIEYGEHKSSSFAQLHNVIRFDNATQPQKPHRGSVWPVSALCHAVVATATVAATMCDDSNTQYLYTSNGEEELDADNIAPPKMPDYRPHEGDEESLKSDDENDTENSPLPSQPRPALNLQSPPKGHRENRPPTSNIPNSPPKPNLPKRGQKRKYTDYKTVENKIAKTEHSIQLLEEHLTNRTCPKSLRYSVKPNITPEETFEKELMDITLDAEQSLVDALTRFHKHQLEGQKNK